jgi:hypothetical protein
VETFGEKRNDDRQLLGRVPIVDEALVTRRIRAVVGRDHDENDAADRNEPSMDAGSGIELARSEERRSRHGRRAVRAQP